MKLFRFFLPGFLIILTSFSVKAQRGFFYSHIPDWDYSHVDSSIQSSIMQDTAVLTDDEIKAMIRLPQSELPQPSDEEIAAQLEARCNAFARGSVLLIQIRPFRNLFG